MIRLGISPHRSVILLPEILPRFYEQFPTSEIFLEERPTYQLRTMLEEEQLDLMIDVPHPDSLNYQNIVLAQEHLVLKRAPGSFPGSSNHHYGSVKGDGKSCTNAVFRRTSLFHAG